VTSVQVVPGTGTLVRHPNALLFVPSAPGGRDTTPIVEAFMRDASGAVVDTVTETVTAHAFDVAPFVLVVWGDHLQLVVLGALEVHTDHPSLPMLSASGSTSWVERRVRLGSDTITVHVGAEPDPETDLQLGRIGADGFAASIRLGPGPDDPLPRSAQNVDVEPVTDPTRPLATDRMAALRAATRSQETPSVADAGESTPNDPSATEQANVPESSPGTPSASAVSESDVQIDDEATITPDVADRGRDGDAPFVEAVRCPRGHVNPAHVAVCRVCGDLVEVGAGRETIRQPPLALLELPTDESLPIDRPLILGRLPDHESAQATHRSQAVVLTGDSSVSRTHLRIDVEDWALTVTDCGSRSGTAIVTRPGEEPRVLEPWMPHELPIGARLFLGGPTSVVVRPISPARAPFVRTEAVRTEAERTDRD
jgi:FHA domain